MSQEIVVERLKTVYRQLRQLNEVLGGREEETTCLKAREIVYHQQLLANFLLPNYRLLNQWLEEHGVSATTATAGGKSSAAVTLVFVLQVKIELEKSIVWITSANHLLTKSLLGFLDTTATSSIETSDISLPRLVNIELLQQTLVQVNSFAGDGLPFLTRSTSQFDVVRFKQIFLSDAAAAGAEAGGGLLRDFHTSLAQQARLVTQLLHQDHHQSTDLDLVLTLLITDYQLNLCLMRNLVMERDNLKLTQTINYLFSSSAINNSLISFINCFAVTNHRHSNSGSYQRQLVVFYSLLFQIFSLIFSKLNKMLTTTAETFDVEVGGVAGAAAAAADGGSANQLDREYKTKLTTLASSLCTSGAFANLIAAMLGLLMTRTPQHSINNTPPLVLGLNSFDICYFLWFLKFMVRYFVLSSNETLVASSSATTSHQQDQESRVYRTASENAEKSFLNDTSSKSAIETKRVLLSYDLFGFVVFKMLESFECLLFDSNSKNVEFMFQYRLREYHNKSKVETGGESGNKNAHVVSSATSVNNLPKIANTHFLKVLYLSVDCLYSLLECISYHLSSLEDVPHRHLHHNRPDNFKRVKNNDEQHFLFLSEFLNFEDLTFSFAFLMRFYCYNPHIYSDSLIKIILLTNKLYLSTFQSTYNLIKQLYQQEERDQLDMSTNATKNSSATTTVSSLNFKPASLDRLYDLYANSDTSFIFRHILVKFVDNDPELNKACIDFLDNLLKKSKKSFHLFHMDLTVALANISMMENFKSLDEHTKHVVSSMLYKLSSLCRRKPNKANRVMFDIRGGGYHQLDNNKYGSSNKRIKLDEQNTSSGGTSGTGGQVNESETTFSSSWSSLRSTSSCTESSQSTSKSSNNNKQQQQSSSLLTKRSLNIQHPPCTLMMMNKAATTAALNSLDHQTKRNIENEFFYCIRSVDIYSGGGGGSAFAAGISSVTNHEYNIKFDHLFKVFNYLVDMYTENVSPIQQQTGKPTAWQVYECLRDLSSSDSNNDQTSITMTNTTTVKHSSPPSPITTRHASVQVRKACATSQFRKRLKLVFIKYSMNKLYKSRRTKSAVFWLFSLMRHLKAYVARSQMSGVTSGQASYLLASSSVSLSSSTSAAHLKTPTHRPSSEFRNKLIANYHSNRLGVPCIPFTLDLQKVFHSVDFSNLVELLGLNNRTKFPHVPYTWLEPTAATTTTNSDQGESKLDECLQIFETFLCK